MRACPAVPFNVGRMRKRHIKQPFIIKAVSNAPFQRFKLFSPIRVHFSSCAEKRGCPHCSGGPYAFQMGLFLVDVVHYVANSMDVGQIVIGYFNTVLLLQIHYKLNNVQ